MNISLVSVFPDLYTSFLQTSLVKRAQQKGVVAIEPHSLFDYVAPKKRIDAPTFGRGAGMLIKPGVVERAVNDCEKKHGKAYKIFFSPQGTKLNQKVLHRIARNAQERGHLMLLPARYEGMDSRVEEHYADEIISVGDFVLMGGDIPAMMLLEGMLRLLPGVVGKQASVEQDSFTGPFVDYPEFTEPVEWKGMRVPDVVRSGDHGALDTWRLNQAVNTSVAKHFDWVRQSTLNADQRKLVKKSMPSHYVALMHTDVLIGQKAMEPGTTSVTSLDIHDIARSATTYGLVNYFIVTPLLDQQRIVNTLLEFWNDGPGIRYNQARHKAVRNVRVADSFDQVYQAITKKEGKEPLVIATSARSVPHAKNISFYDQQEVWQYERPVLFLLGTGQGLTPEIVDRCDYLVPPVKGFTDFNHLSVRSAAAIIFDRWLGNNVKNA